MPFTLSHPAAAVPFYRWRFVLSALVVGSISPDLEYFLHASKQDRMLHTYPGVLLYTFPITILILGIFHGLLKWPVISLLPRGWQQRLVGPARTFSWWPAERLGWILLSLALGITTHLAWDAFAHNDGWVAYHWRAWNASLFQVKDSVITLSVIAQYGGSALGMAVLVLYVVRWYRRAPQGQAELPPQLSPAATAVLVLVLSVVAAGAGCVAGAKDARSTRDLHFWRRLISGFAITTTSVGVVELAAFSSVWWLVVIRARNTPSKSWSSSSGDIRRSSGLQK